MPMALVAAIKTDGVASKKFSHEGEKIVKEKGISINDRKVAELLKDVGAADKAVI